MTRRSRQRTSMRRGNFCTALLVACILAPTAAAAGAPSFVDSGNIFGTKKGHFGRCNAWADIDGNGLYDVITGGHDDGLLAYSQDTPLVFRRVDTEIGLADFNKPLFGILLLDFDRDGDKDLILNQVGFGEPDGTPTLRYLRNNGSGHFFEATTQVGFHEAAHGFGMAALDYDKDGWLDLYILNHRSANALYHNLGDGTFEDVTASAGVDGLNGRPGDATGIATLDYDRDGWVDIFVTQREETNEQFPLGNNLLFHNQGDGTFINRAAEAGVAGYSHDFVASAHDINGDGWYDLFAGTFNFAPTGVPITNFPCRTYLNQGDGTFLDVSLISGADYIGGNMGIAMEDADNDGDPDLYLGTGGPFDGQIEGQIYYDARGDGYFFDRTAEAGLTCDARGHGSTWLDVDRDGDMDLFASLGGATVGAEYQDKLYINQGPTGSAIEVAAQGNDCTLEGIGVWVECFSASGVLRREISATAGFDSQRPPVAWFGLGSQTGVDSLVVHWPCGRRQVQYDVPTDTALVIVEPSSQVPVLDLGLSSMRERMNEVNLRLGPVSETFDPASIELWRQLDRQSWIQRSVVWQREGEDLVARDGEVPQDREIGYLIRVPSDGASGAAWIERETRVAAARLMLRATNSPFLDRVDFVANGVEANARLRIFDIRGREVRSFDLSQGVPESGGVRWTWDGRDGDGRSVARGAYVVDLQSQEYHVQRTVWKAVR